MKRTPKRPKEPRPGRGGTLLSVRCDTSEQISRAKELLKGTGATDIASTSEAAGIKTVTRVA
jgi:hyperosmotically inducible protein